MSYLCGHYIAHIKERESDVWYKFNDEEIEKMKNRKLELGKEDDTLSVEGSSDKTPKLAKGIHSSRNAYMLVYSKCQDKTGAKSSSSLVPIDLLPANVKGYVEKDNQDFEDWIEERLRNQTEVIANKKQAYEEMRYLYTSLPVKSLSEPWEWITTEWLTKWLTDPTSVDKVSNNVPKCQHEKIPADEVVKLKCISEAAASCLFAKYPIDMRYNGPTMLCENCIRMQCRKIRWQRNMANDDKLFNCIKNNKSNKISMPLDPNEEFFWVSTKHLRSWKRFALQSMPQELSSSPSSSSSSASPANEAPTQSIQTKEMDTQSNQISPNFVLNCQSTCNQFENTHEGSESRSREANCDSKVTSTSSNSLQPSSHSQISLVSSSCFNEPSECSDVTSSNSSSFSTPKRPSCNMDHAQEQYSSRNICKFTPPGYNSSPGSSSVDQLSGVANKGDDSEKIVSSSQDNQSGSSEQDSGKGHSMDEAVSSETCESPDSGIIVLKTTMQDFCDTQDMDLTSTTKSAAEDSCNDKVEDDDNKDEEMMDERDDRNEVFNSDMLCQHGNLRVDETGRRLVKREIWERLLFYFPHIEPFTPESPICQLCLESLQFEYMLKQNRKQAGQGQKDVLQDLYHSRNRPKIYESWAGRSAFIVSSNFLEGWRKFVKHSVKLDSDLEIVNAPLLCEHNLLLYSMDDMNAIDSVTRFTLVWDDEWQKLIGYFNFDVEIQVMQSFSEKNGNSILISKPDVCSSCLNERIHQEEEGKFVFSAQTVYVRKVVDGQKFDGKGDENGSEGKSKGYNYDPEFSAPPPEKMSKLESNGQRKSSRHRKTRGEKEVVVSSSMTLKEFKIKLCPLFCIAPFDQNLSLDGRSLKGDEMTLQEFRFYPQCVVALQADEISGEAVAEHEDFMNLPSRPEEGFKGTNLMGR